MKLAEVLEQYRWAKKLTLRDFAKELGFSHTSLGRFLNGGKLDGANLAKVFRWLLEEA